MNFWNRLFGGKAAPTVTAQSERWTSSPRKARPTTDVRTASAEYRAATTEHQIERSIRSLVSILTMPPSGSWEPDRAADALVSIGAPAILPLVGELRKRDYGEARVTEVLARIGAPSVEPALSVLLPALKHHNPFVRANAMQALGKIGGPRAVLPLISELGSNDEYRLPHHFYTTKLCNVAIRALGNTHDRRAVEPILAALSDLDRFDYGAVLEALSELGDPRAVEPLAKVAASGSSQYAQIAVKGLGKTRDPRALTPLLTALEETSRFNGPIVAAKAICELGYPSAAVEPLIRILGTIYGMSAAEALGDIGDARAVDALIERRWAYSEEVAIALGQIGDARAVEPLTEMLGYEGRSVAKNAAKALGMIGDARAVDPLIANLTRFPWEVTRALGKIGDARALDPLLAFLRDSKNADAPSEVANAIAQIGDASALERLLHIAVETDWSFHVDALIALGSKYRDELDRFLIPIMQSSESIKARGHAAGILVTLGDPRVKSYLPTILLDWLEFHPRSAGIDLRLMAEHAGIDAALFEAAQDALSYELNLESEGSNGQTLESYYGGMSAVMELCRRADAWATCVLYRVTRKQDISVSFTSGAFVKGADLTFERERAAAAQELRRRRISEAEAINLLRED